MIGTLILQKFASNEAEFENLISTADPLGYSILDDLGYMMEDSHIELTYYDELDEDE